MNYLHKLTISLKQNKLKKITAAIFKHNHELYDVDLNDNAIEYIDVVVFNELSNLRFLHIGGNKAALIFRIYHLWKAV